MRNINDILTNIEAERISNKIVLKGKISSEYYNDILKAFFLYTKIVEDTLNGKKKYICDIGTFSYYQLAYGQISRFNGKIVEKSNNGEEETIIVVESDVKEKAKRDEEESILANIYDDAKENSLIDIYFDTDIQKAEQFFNYMDTSIFENVKSTKPAIQEQRNNIQPIKQIQNKNTTNNTNELNFRPNISTVNESNNIKPIELKPNKPIKPKTVNNILNNIQSKEPLIKPLDYKPNNQVDNNKQLNNQPIFNSQNNNNNSNNNNSNSNLSNENAANTFFDTITKRIEANNLNENNNDFNFENEEIQTKKFSIGNIKNKLFNSNKK